MTAGMDKGGRMRKWVQVKRHILVVSALLAGFAGPSPGAPDEPRKLTVSASSVAGNDEKSDQAADYFAQRIGMGRNYQAKRAGNCPWDEVPPGGAAESQVNVLQLKFDNRVELLAVMLDTNRGGVALAARAPALIQAPIPHLFRAPSGDCQFPENAPNDLVANFAFALEHPSAFKGSYQLILKTGEPNDKGGDKGESWEKSFTPKNAGIARVYPLAAAALYAENFQACTRTQESVIVLSFKMDEMECAVRAELYRGDRKIQELERAGIKYEKLYDSLRLLFLNLIEWQDAVADFYNPGRDGFQPSGIIEMDNEEPGALENEKIVLVGKGKDGLSAFEPSTGNKPWERLFEKGETAVCRNGQLFLYNAPKLARVSAASGKPEFSIATENVEQTDALRDLCVYGSYRQLRLFDKATELWSRELPGSIQAGPLLAEDGIALGDAKGEFRWFDLKGEELWTVSLPRSVYGEIYANGGLFFADDDSGGMSVIDRQGRLVWRAEIGDVMTGAPQVVGTAIVVGSKSGKLFLFDKSSGACLKTHAFSSWLLGFRVVDQKILCVTLDKRLQVFDLARFELEKTLRFPFAFNPEIMPVKEFPQKRIHDPIDLARKISGCLLSDVKGNVFLYSTAPIPGIGESPRKGDRQ